MTLLFFIIFAAHAGLNPLQLAISTCEVDKVTRLLEQGSDPNAKDFQGQPIVRWVGSNRKCDDERALATLKLLAAHGGHFASQTGVTSFLTVFANRGFPRALAFLVQQKESGNPTDALRAISQRGPPESIKILLAAGADPAVLEKKEFHKPEPVKLKCPRTELTGELVSLAQRLKLPNDCKFVEESGELVLIDCNSPADGPAYYLNKKTGDVVATCGGACMRGNCTNCPPKAWAGECKL